MFWLECCSIKHNLSDINTQAFSKVLRLGGNVFLGGKICFYCRLTTNFTNFSGRNKIWRGTNAGLQSFARLCKW